MEEQKYSTGLVWREAKLWLLQTVARFSDWGENKARGTSAFYCLLKYIHDGVVQLREHHKVNRKAGAAILSGRVACEPGQCVVLLQDKPAKEKEKLEAYSYLRLLFFKKVFLTCTQNTREEEGDLAVELWWFFWQIPNLPNGFGQPKTFWIQKRNWREGGRVWLLLWCPQGSGYIQPLSIEK